MEEWGNVTFLYEQIEREIVIVNLNLCCMYKYVSAGHKTLFFLIIIGVIESDY